MGRQVRPLDLVTVLEDQAACRPDRPFLVMAGDVRLTFAEFNRRVNRVAHGLADAGVEHQEPVVILMSNSLEFLLASYALKKLGAIEVPVNTEIRGAGLLHVLRQSKARLLILAEELAPFVAAVAHQLPDVRRVVVRGSAAVVKESLPELAVSAFEDVMASREDNPGIAVAPSDVAAILFTSGTSGPSKGCVLSHRYAVTQGELIAQRLGFVEEDCLYCPFPLHHIDAAHLTVVAALVSGARAAIGVRFSASRFWEEVREFGATVFDFMGATLAILWKQPERLDDADNPVRLAWGVPIPSWRREFEARFGLTLLHCYGLTDAGMPCYEDPAGPQPPASCGKPAHPYDVRIFDQCDEEVAPGVSGEIVIRPLEPDVMMKGYWGMPQATLEAFRNLWFHTGDIGRMDAEGHLFFIGRKKDSIRRRGENISAYEIEQVIETHPAVIEVAAVGVPSPLSEEDVAVFIVVKADSELTAKDVQAFCRGRMAKFMIPEVVRFVSEIPKTATGKAEKYRLVSRDTPAATDA